MALERAAWALGVGALWGAGYFALGNATSAASTRTLATWVDDRIPFLAWSVWIYLLGVVGMLLPLFVPGCRNLFRRTALAYCAVLLASFACFYAWPVTSLGLRPREPFSTSAPLTSWMLRSLYAIDPPYNLFPSLHVSLTCVAAFSVWRSSRSLGALCFAIAALVSVSVCTVKQHFLLDVAGGVVLAGAAGALIVHPIWRRSGSVPDVASPATRSREPGFGDTRGTVAALARKSP